MLGKTHMTVTGALVTGAISLNLTLNRHFVPILTPLSNHIGHFFRLPYDLPTPALLVVCSFYVASSMFGALLPDIDSETSLLGRHVPYLSKNIPHRTITHSAYAVIFLVLLNLSLLQAGVFKMITLGYFLHIVEDSYSYQGISWFSPVTGYIHYSSGAVVKKGHHKGVFHYRTGSKKEKHYKEFFTLVFILNIIWLFTVL